MKTAFVSVFLLSASPVQGAEAAIAHGRAAFHGDLSSETTAPLFIAQGRQMIPVAISSPGYSLRSYVGLEVLQSAARAKSTRFPYDEGADLTLLGFFMTPGLCLQSGLPVDLCAGIGIGTLNVNSKANRQDYGTWNYEAALSYPLGERMFLRAAGKKVGDVEQTHDGQAARFWLTSYMLAFGISE